MATVFDVAAEFLKRSKGNSISPLKLQKLCFYAFGWYAHQTDEPLFDERFWAMEFGPVVGELLSAHAQKKRFTLEQLEAQFTVRDMVPGELGGYERAVIGAVWDSYGDMTPGELVEETHKEQVWIDAWGSRPSGSRRADLPHGTLVDYFMSIDPKRVEGLDLPDPRGTLEDASWLKSFDASDPKISQRFIDEITDHYLSHAI